MNLLPPVTDNISELLAHIVVFTEIRESILIRNIRDLNTPGFVPKDLAVEEFSHLLNRAIAEHIQNERIVLCDSANVTFGPNGSLHLDPIVDEHAKILLERSQDKYVELQIIKLLENSLNQMMASQLLRQKQDAMAGREQPMENQQQYRPIDAQELPVCWDKEQDWMDVGHS